MLRNGKYWKGALNIYLFFLRGKFFLGPESQFLDIPKTGISGEVQPEERPCKLVELSVE